MLRASNVQAPRAPERIRVLVVDDDPDLCGAWSALLARHGFLAAAVSDPARASRRADEFRPHVALLDFDMPRITGPELAVLLRRTPAMIRRFAGDPGPRPSQPRGDVVLNSTDRRAAPRRSRIRRP